MSVLSKIVLRSNSATTAARLRSSLANASRAVGDPGPLLCCEKSGSLSHSIENRGTPSFHNPRVKAVVVHRSWLMLGYVTIFGKGAPSLARINSAIAEGGID